ncbi:MAG: NAD(P)-binding domain-containing protein, partial [Candidatus Macondimonas sp.]
MDPFIGFIGGGNMASSLIAGLIRQGTPGASLGVAEPDAEKRQQLATIPGLRATPDNALIAQRADVLVLAVKPQALQAVSLALRVPLAGRDPLVISIAAGIGTDALARWLGPSLPIVRAMPNTPALMGHGAT